MADAGSRLEDSKDHVVSIRMPLWGNCMSSGDDNLGEIQPELGVEYQLDV